MELLKQKEPLEFKHKDVTFLVKAEASDGDRMEVLSSGALNAEGSGVAMTKSEFYRALVRTMVVGWRNVTFNGKDVPYAYSTLLHSFPQGEKGLSVIIELAAFILEHTDILHKDELEKNGSRERSGGSRK